MVRKAILSFALFYAFITTMSTNYKDLKTQKRADILVMIPAYDEGRNISGVIEEVKQYWWGKVDIVVINDGSSDDTSIVAKQSGVQVIDLPFNLGIGGAVQTGYLFASRNDYKFAVQIDGDGQHDPSCLGNLLEPVLSGSADIAIGSRYIEKTSYKSPISRRVGMFIFSLMLKVFTGWRIYDPTSGYRAANRKVINMFAKSYPTDYPEVESIMALRKKSFKIKEIPVVMNQRKEGYSSITPWKAFYYMVKVSLSIMISAVRSKHEMG